MSEIGQRVARLKAARDQAISQRDWLGSVDWGEGEAVAKAGDALEKTLADQDRVIADHDALIRMLEERERAQGNPKASSAPQT